MKKFKKYFLKNPEAIKCEVVSNLGQDVLCYFLIGRAERAFKTVSVPDLAPLNTEGAGLPVFSGGKKHNKQNAFPMSLS